jgi:ABC-type Zn uptake system ZnuABC Zn-binding protein ZnuA
MKTSTLLPISWILASLVAWAAPSAAPRTEPLRVVATLPDLADIVKEIGGDRVDVTTIARGKENTHAVPVKPSHLVAMSKADLFVQIGLSLESSYVPGLLEGCRNKSIQAGQPGFLNVSEGWTPLDVPVSLSRKEGDVHPQGNPHLNLDPSAGRHMAGKILEGLVRVDPSGKADYEARYDAYLKKLEPAEKRWAETAKAWSGKQVVVYHQEYNYLANAYGLAILGALEPKPGIAPTPDHIAEIIGKMKAANARVILTALWSNNSTVARVAEETGATVVELPNMCGGLPGTDTWIDMMNVVHERLAKAFDATGAAAR